MGGGYKIVKIYTLKSWEGNENKIDNIDNDLLDINWSNKFDVEPILNVRKCHRFWEHSGADTRFQPGGGTILVLKLRKYEQKNLKNNGFEQGSKV